MAAGAFLIGFSTLAATAGLKTALIQLSHESICTLPFGAGFFGAGGTGTHSLSFNR